MIPYEYLIVNPFFPSLSTAAAPLCHHREIFAGPTNCQKSPAEIVMEEKKHGDFMGNSCFHGI